MNRMRASHRRLVILSILFLLSKKLFVPCKYLER